MRYIAELVDMIYDETDGAKEYAEKYVQLKAENDAFAPKFKEMAQQELNHATTIHEYAVSKINKLETIYTPPQEMRDIWDKAHKNYVEKVAWIKQMLTL